MKQVTLPKKSRQRNSRRSTRRLGKTPAVMENRVSQPSLAIKPALTFWSVNRSRIVGVIALLLLGWITWLLFANDAFYVYGATVEGNHILNAQEIYDAAEIHTVSVFWLNPGEVKKRIEVLPNIKTARVAITLPANVTLTVEERQPEIVWQTGEKTWWVDNEGIIVPPRTEVDGTENRLRIIDLDAAVLKEKDHLDLDIIDGAQIIHHYKPDIVELYHNRASGLIYLSPEGWPVYLGDSLDIEAKLVVADAMRSDLQARGITPTFIDVRNPLRAVYEEAKGTDF